MSDFNKLKSYLNESKASSIGTSTLNFLQQTFNKSTESLVSQQEAVNSATADNWFSQADNDPFCPTLSKKQRIIGFIACILMGVFCMAIASFYIPMILFKSRKFVLLFSVGSVFFMASFSLLWGLRNHLKQLTNASRLPFTLSYIGSLLATIYYALIVKSVILTLIFAIIQACSLVWYLVSYLPGGQTGFKFFVKIFYSLVSKSVSTTLQV